MPFFLFIHLVLSFVLLLTIVLVCSPLDVELLVANGNSPASLAEELKEFLGQESAGKFARYCEQLLGPIIQQQQRVVEEERKEAEKLEAEIREREKKAKQEEIQAAKRKREEMERGKRLNE